MIRLQAAEGAHEVVLLCNCSDIEACRTEVYASDVRLAYATVNTLKARLAAVKPPIKAGNPAPESRDTQCAALDVTGPR